MKPPLDEDTTKACVTMRPGLHAEVKHACDEYGIKLKDAYTSGMEYWLREMRGEVGYKPVNRMDHEVLEAILNRGVEKEIEAVRAVLAAFLARETGS